MSQKEKVHVQKVLWLVVVCCFLILTLSACTNEANDASWNDIEFPPDISEMELTAERLEIWWDDDFGVPHDRYATEYLTKQYTQTTLDVQTFTFNQTGSNPPSIPNDLFNMLRTKHSPDLIVFDSRHLPLLIDIGYLDPIKVNLGYFEIDSSVIMQIRNMAPNGELYAMPYGYSPAGLLYNKSIFDEMEVEYPRDGMTWEEVFELARRVADPSKWDALLVQDYDLVTSQLSLRLIDPDTQEVDFESEAWNRVEAFAFELKTFQNHERQLAKITAFTNGRAAMLAVLLFDNLRESPAGLYARVMQSGVPDVEWDVVRIPVFDDGKSLAPANPMLLIGVPRQSLNKTDAQIAMQYLLSKQVQDANTRKGFVSLRADMKPEEFAKELDFLADKNKQAFLRPATEAGTYDPELDYLPIIDYKIETIMKIPSIDSIEGTIEHVKKEIEAEVRMYMDKRSRLIKEVRGKYGWDSK